LIVFNPINLGGALIGHCLAEYVIQPSKLNATKREWKNNKRYALIAGLIHSTIWTACVTVFGLYGVAVTLPQIAMFSITLLTLHFVADCTRFPLWLAEKIGVQHLANSIEPILQRWSDIVFVAEDQNQRLTHKELMEIVSGLMLVQEEMVGQRLFEIGIHCAVIVLAWMVF